MSKLNDNKPFTVRCPSCQKAGEPDFNETTRRYVCAICASPKDSSSTLDWRETRELLTYRPKNHPIVDWEIVSFGLKEAAMGRQKHTTEQIISKLREAEVLQGKGMPMEEVLRQLGISDATYYRLYLSKKCLPMPAMHRSEPWKP